MTSDAPEPPFDPAVPVSPAPDAPLDAPETIPPGEPPSFDAAAPPAPPARPALSPARAVAEVVLCSGFPTQLLIGALLVAGGLPPYTRTGDLSAPFVFVVSMADALVLLSLIWVLLRAEGVRPIEVLIGRRAPWREALLGVSLTPLVLLFVSAIILAARAMAPWVHNVEENPLTSLIGTQEGLLATLAVAIVAGGVREEVQRAFLLRRFANNLGGRAVGLLITSVAFGLGHTPQGWDAAIATGILGALWGLLTLARGGVVASMACHAGFNTLELMIASVTMGRFE